MGRGAASCDYDNDGDLDLFITNSNDSPNLLRNDGGNVNNWILIKTVGTNSNIDGIGTKVILSSGDQIQIDEVRSGASYLCQNDLQLHFGVEKVTRIDRVEIRWPSGLVETYKELETNQLLIVTEGKGIQQRNFQSD